MRTATFREPRAVWPLTIGRAYTSENVSSTCPTCPGLDLTQSEGLLLPHNLPLLETCQVHCNRLRPPPVSRESEPSPRGIADQPTECCCKRCVSSLLALRRHRDRSQPQSTSSCINLSPLIFLTLYICPCFTSLILLSIICSHRSHPTSTVYDPFSVTRLQDLFCISFISPDTRHSLLLFTLLCT